MNVTKKRALTALIVIVLLVITAMLPTPSGLTTEAKNLIGIIIGALIIWFTEVIPFPISAGYLIIVPTIMGVTTFGNAVTNSMTSVILFVIATSALTCAFVRTPLANRIALSLVKKSGSKSSNLIFVFMFGTALVSTVISNVPATAMFAALAVSVLNAAGEKPGESKIGTALMIAVPLGAIAGGIATPAGSSINILALDLLEKYTGLTVRFLDWMIMGVPMMIVLLFVFTFLLVRLCKPNDLSVNVAEVLNKENAIPEKLTTGEIKTLCILAVMMVLWIASTWVPAINVTVVAIGGMIVFFLPGIDLFTWDEFKDEVGWDTLLLIGSITSLGSAIVSSGLSSWLLGSLLGGLSNVGIIPLCIIVAVIVTLLHFPLPVSAAIMTMSAAALCELATGMGASPVIIIVVACFMAGFVLILPLDPIPLIAYKYGYFSIKQLLVIGLVIGLVWSVLTGVWIPIIGGILGY